MLCVTIDPGGHIKLTVCSTHVKVCPCLVSVWSVAGSRLTLRSSDPCRSLCCRPEVLPVLAGVPVWVHRWRRDRRRGEHRWVQLGKTQDYISFLVFIYLFKWIGATSEMHDFCSKTIGWSDILQWEIVKVSFSHLETFQIRLIVLFATLLLPRVQGQAVSWQGGF